MPRYSFGGLARFNTCRTQALPCFSTFSRVSGSTLTVIGTSFFSGGTGGRPMFFGSLMDAL
jgi:hypothetical protein